MAQDCRLVKCRSPTRAPVHLPEPKTRKVRFRPALKLRAMKIWLPRKYRPTVSKWYLDLAERMRKRTKGRIHAMQQVRADQRRDFARNAPRAQLPADSGLQFKSIYLVEVFPIEDLSNVSRGLLQLFPTLTETPLEDFRENFAREAVDFETTFYRPIGKIVRTRDIIPSMEQVVRSDLPPFVQYIEIGASKILASILMILMEVHLTEDATKRLREVTASTVLSKVVFPTLLPWKVGYSRTQTNQTEELRSSLLKWFAKIRVSAEEFLTPFISGYFANNVRSRPRLPALELFALSGVDSDPSNFRAWMEASAGWRRTIGLDFERDYFIDSRAVYAYAFRRRPEAEPVDRIVELEDFWRITPDDPNLARTAGVAHEIFLRSINSLLDFIAIRAYLENSTEEIGRLRYELYKSMRGELSLPRYIAYHSSLLDRLTLLGRLKADFEDQKHWLRINLASFDDFIYTTQFVPKSKGPPLSGWLIESLEHTLQRNAGYVQQLAKAYSDFVALESMRVNYWLQVWVALLTLVAFYASIVGIWGLSGALKWFQNASLADRALGFFALAVPLLLVISWRHLGKAKSWFFRSAR